MSSTASALQRGTRIIRQPDMNPSVPATLDDMIVTVGDMFVVGYCAVREWVDERHGEYGMERGVGGRNVRQA